MKNKTLFGDSKLVIYTDGGARGNPGPSAAGFVIGDPSAGSTKLTTSGLLRHDSGQVGASKEYGEYLGTHTNNYAEYMAVILALKKAKALLGKTKAKTMEVEVRMDSELIVRQLGRRYKVLEPDLKPLFVDVLNLILDFKKVEFRHIPREQNKRADKMVNEVLDSRA